ncbi:hypothetical protein [Halopelagius longus]|uniref:Halo transducer protein n=1 Tax=Halopelagius longus TaxID=1236180 RepID=A0A1H0XNG0_9EURY|nr:hypothetical protein [Halopelagius longus]RDI71961.1 halo transducer protein [Halopelagius longus]SDQ04457.1 hypothetical protein SAMN05216278_0031 [Halopelagius longus]
MSSEDGDASPDDIVGLSVREATDALVSENPARDPESVRAVLDHVTEDGVVTRDALEEAFSDASMVLGTAETRTELASMALAEARETAAPVSDLETVRARLDAFESAVTDLQRRATDLGSDLQTLVRRRDDSGSIYDLVTDLRRVTSDAKTVQRTADALQTDLEAFERWATDADARFRELDADADALERSLDASANVVEKLADGDESGRETLSLPTTDDAVAADAAWADATLRLRVVELLVADARAELADLRRWADRENDRDAAFDARAEELERRFDELDEKRETLGRRLDALGRPAWRERHGDRLSGFDAALDDFEPPVAWGDVRGVLERYRPALEGAA